MSRKQLLVSSFAAAVSTIIPNTNCHIIVDEGSNTSYNNLGSPCNTALCSAGHVLCHCHSRACSVCACVCVATEPLPEHAGVQ